MDEVQVNTLIKTFVQALKEQNAAVFAGAGLSIPAGAVDWKELMRCIAEDIGLDVDKEHDLVTVAQFHVNKWGRHRINQKLINEFSSRATTTENHAILASLPIRTYWTTNYDTQIEEALRLAQKKPDIKITTENLATTLQRRDAVVYKMHGDVSQPDKAVVTKDDYEAYNTTRQLFSTALQGDLVSKTFLFIGFSFNDPNLSYVLSRIRVLLDENQREHFALLRMVQRSDFEDERDFDYACAKQDLQVRDLRRYGITGLLLDDYEKYTVVLRRIQQKYNMSRIFISGSAKTYDPWSNSDARQLVQELAKKLVGKGFGIVSGFGLGIGAYVVNGVLELMELERTRLLDNRLILRPFPHAIDDMEERKRKWTAYRREMLSHAGIAIFVFGNKENRSGETVLANGVEEEFEIAVQKGLAVVPVGCTGSMAEELYSRVLGNFEQYYPGMTKYKKQFEELGRLDSPEKVANCIVKIIERLEGDA